MATDETGCSVLGELAARDGQLTIQLHHRTATFIAFKGHFITESIGVRASYEHTTAATVTNGRFLHGTSLEHRCGSSCGSSVRCSSTRPVHVDNRR